MQQQAAQIPCFWCPLYGLGLGFGAFDLNYKLHDNPHMVSMDALLLVGAVCFASSLSDKE
jgi:hypothetical protein